MVCDLSSKDIMHIYWKSSVDAASYCMLYASCMHFLLPV
ncbi:hypothetical protein M141_4167 [Bacteroides fragilis str. S38L5]|nr:hypothetical protein M075_4452 [Bacteroides fragilis str. 20793-3]EYA93835.1 hypothetical protein M141_4167 [Bacteroides fragilis str. S38L5]EYB12511.1 hypothetical protein M140_4119 [Bacteroides fragilis str. S38L3]